MASAHIDSIREELAKSEIDFFQRTLLSGIRTVSNETIRQMEDKRFEYIKDKSQSLPVHTFSYPEVKSVPNRSAEEWFLDFYRQSEKQRDPTVTVRNDGGLKKWRESLDEEKKPYYHKALEDKIRFDKEHQEYLEAKKLVQLSSGDSFRSLVTWNETINHVLQDMEPQLARTVMDLSRKHEEILNKPIDTQSKLSIPRTNGIGKRKRETITPITTTAAHKSKQRRNQTEEETTARPKVQRSKEQKIPTSRSRKGSNKKDESKEKKSRSTASTASKSTKRIHGGGGTAPYNAFRAQYKQRHPDLVESLSTTELTKRIGLEWHQMSLEEKQPFGSKPNREEKEEVDEEVKSRKVLKASKIPKRAPKVNGVHSENSSPLNNSSHAIVPSMSTTLGAPPAPGSQLPNSIGIGASSNLQVTLPAVVPANQQQQQIAISQFTTPQSNVNRHSFFDSPEHEEDFTSFEIPSNSDTESQNENLDD